MWMQDLRRTLTTLTSLLGPATDPDEPQPFDLDLARVIDPAVAAIVHGYFRGEVHGLEKLPEGPALIAGNHNAGITSFEPFLLGYVWYKLTGGKTPIYFLGHDAMVSLPVVGNLLKRLGTIRASHEAASRAFAQGNKVLVLPGGNKEAFRPFWQRHQVDFCGRTGFVRLALQNSVPIVPMLCLGGHETLMVLGRGEALARWTGVKRYLRSDSFPIFLGLPWGVGLGPIFHLPLPAKLVVELGDPIAVDEVIEAAGGPQEAANDVHLLRELSARTEAAVQAMMDRRAAERRPFIG